MHYTKCFIFFENVQILRVAWNSVLPRNNFSNNGNENSQPVFTGVMINSIVSLIIVRPYYGIVREVLVNFVQRLYVSVVM